MNLDQVDIKYQEHKDEEFIKKMRYFEEIKKRKIKNIIKLKKEK